MKKKILTTLLVLLGIIILLAISIFLYFNQVVEVTKQTGKFFDTSGKQLGTCIIEKTWRRLATVPASKTIYYNEDQSKIGSCEGESGTKIDLEKKNEPAICNPKVLQEKCDPSIYPDAYPFCSKAKYKCNIEIN